MQALLLLSSLPESWETLVVSLSNSAPNGKLTTSMVMDALFNKEARRREMGSTNQSESQALVSEGSRERGRGQGRGHHRGIGKGQWRSQARGRTVSMRGTYIWMANNMSSKVVGRGSVRFRMADGRSVTLTKVRHVPNLRKNLISIGMLDSKGCSFDASGGILRVSKENKEMLWGKKTRGLYRLEGSVQIGGATTVRHESNGISKENGQGKQPLHRGTQSKRRGTWRIRSGTRAQGDALGYVRKSGQTRVMQPVQDVHREAQRKENKSILRSCTAKGAATPKRVSFALDLISGEHPGGGCGAPSGGVQGHSVRRCRHFGVEVIHFGGSGVALDRLRYLGCCLAVYGRARSEAVRKDNLKTSDYPPGGGAPGWRCQALRSVWRWRSGDSGEPWEIDQENDLRRQLLTDIGLPVQVQAGGDVIVQLSPAHRLDGRVPGLMNKNLIQSP
ncbi:hypothetical protein Acr_00g0028380 [Actinidia rufa]|uniref:Retrovirus-related Pol polyprotein from transposon TNT 1-94-like beta-barrel domain-containing protein n=1 Tax=Actinidia rufa TaxID=165716 RepID=A0A7J0DES9_9ERIC|nr:hypothetical protein Acr_00g0028380 [Actinidia rufa]